MSHFTTDICKTLGTIYDYALIDSSTNREETSTQPSYIQVHPLVLPVVKTLLTSSEWESHMRRTLLTLCHAFMEVRYGGQREIEFFKCADAISSEIYSILPGDTDKLSSAPGRETAHAAFFSAELDDFSLHFGGDWTPQRTRKDIEHVFSEFAAGCASGNLSRMHEAVKYANKWRGREGDSGGSQGVWWYSGKKLRVKQYLYD